MSKSTKLTQEEIEITNHFIKWLAKETDNQYSDAEDFGVENHIIDTVCFNKKTQEKLQFQVTVADGKTKENCARNTRSMKQDGDMEVIDSDPKKWIEDQFKKKNTNKYSPAEEEKTILLIKAPITFLGICEVNWPTNIETNYKGVYLINLPRMSSQPTSQTKEGLVITIKNISSED